MSQTDLIAPTETRNERRRRLTDEKIAATVLDIALNKGPHNVTFSAVSAESGVAKTTLYRRYQTREELFDAVARHFSSTPNDSDEAPTTPEGLAATLRRGVSTLEEHMGLETIGTLLASRDEFMQRIFLGLQLPRQIGQCAALGSDIFLIRCQNGALDEDAEAQEILIDAAEHAQTGHPQIVELHGFGLDGAGLAQGHAAQQQHDQGQDEKPAGQASSDGNTTQVEHLGFTFARLV